MKKDGKESMFTIQDGVLLKYIGKEPDVVIPDEVTEIAKNAFFRKTTPVTITIPSTVKVLQPYALAECKSLEKLIVEPGTTILPEGARFVKVFFISFRSIPHAQHHSHSSLLPLETIRMRKDCINKTASKLANRGFLC